MRVWREFPEKSELQNDSWNLPIETAILKGLFWYWHCIPFSILFFSYLSFIFISLEPPGTFSSACQGLHATSGVRMPHRARQNRCQDLHFGIMEEHDHVVILMTLNLRAWRSKSASPMSHPSSGKPSLRISCSTALISTWISYKKIGQKFKCWRI